MPISDLLDWKYATMGNPPDSLVRALLKADAEQEAADENLQRLKDYARLLANFKTNVYERPDLEHRAPPVPMLVAAVEVQVGQPVLKETAQPLATPEADFAPAPPPPSGKVSVTKRKVLNGGGEWIYQINLDDTAPDGFETRHPVTGERIRKRATPFGGMYVVVP